MNLPNHEGIQLSMFNRPMPDKAQKYLVYILSAYTMILLITFIFMVYQNHNIGLSATLTNQRSITMLTELNNLQGQLQKIDFNQNPENLKATISTLATKLAGVEKILTDNAKNSDMEKSISIWLYYKLVLMISKIPFFINSIKKSIWMLKLCPFR